MGLGAALLVIIGSAIASGFLALAARQFVRLEVRRRHHEVGTAVFLQIGVIFAVLLAFVFSDVWGEYNSAALAINAECGSLHGTAILANTLPTGQRTPIEHLIAGYIRSVIDDEWPVMAATRHKSEQASRRFRQLWQAVAALPATGGTEAATRAEMLSLLARAHQTRETRLFEMTLGVPAFLWSLLAFFSVLIVGCVAFCGLEYALSQVILTALLGASIAFILVLVALLDYPFEGALQIPPADFQGTLSSVLLLLGHG